MEIPWSQRQQRSSIHRSDSPVCLQTAGIWATRMHAHSKMSYCQATFLSPASCLAAQLCYMLGPDKAGSCRVHSNYATRLEQTRLTAARISQASAHELQLGPPLHAVPFTCCPLHMLLTPLTRCSHHELQLRRLSCAGPSSLTPSPWQLSCRTLKQGLPLSSTSPHSSLC